MKNLRNLQMQGRWLEWTDVMFKDFSWSSLLYGGTGRDPKFLLASTMNVLPTPDNLRHGAIRLWINTVNFVISRQPFVLFLVLVRPLSIKIVIRGIMTMFCQS